MENFLEFNWHHLPRQSLILCEGFKLDLLPSDISVRILDFCEFQFGLLIGNVINLLS